MDSRRHPERQLENPAFADLFERAGEAWDVAVQVASLRKRAGLSQAELARKMKTRKSVIEKLESPGYTGHSLTMLRRVARAMGAQVRVVFEPENDAIRPLDIEVPHRVPRAPRSKRG